MIGTTNHTAVVERFSASYLDVVNGGRVAFLNLQKILFNITQAPKESKFRKMNGQKVFPWRMYISHGQ